jgi:hypothetical protein
MVTMPQRKPMPIQMIEHEQGHLSAFFEEKAWMGIQNRLLA